MNAFSEQQRSMSGLQNPDLHWYGHCWSCHHHHHHHHYYCHEKKGERAYHILQRVLQRRREARKRAVDTHGVARRVSPADLAALAERTVLVGGACRTLVSRAKVVAGTDPPTRVVDDDGVVRDVFARDALVVGGAGARDQKVLVIVADSEVVAWATDRRFPVAPVVGFTRDTVLLLLPRARPATAVEPRETVAVVEGRRRIVRGRVGRACDSRSRGAV